MEENNVLIFFKQLLDSNEMYHATTLVCPNQTQLDEMSNNLVRLIVCQNNSLENDGCELCIRFEKKILLNFKTIGDSINQIKRETISDLISEFSLTTFEKSTKKIYVIKNAENLNEGASNAILKFLEEPPKGVFAILLSNDKSQILQTIKSRCKMISIKEKINLNEVDKTLLKLIKLRDTNKLLLEAENFKQKDKKEQIEILSFTFNNKIVKTNPRLAEIFLDVIFEVKRETYLNLIIENFFINLYEVLACE